MIQLTTPSHGPSPPHSPRYHCNLVTVTDLPFKIILQWLQCSLVFPCCAVFMLACVCERLLRCLLPSALSWPRSVPAYYVQHRPFLASCQCNPFPHPEPTSPFSPTSVPGSELRCGSTLHISIHIEPNLHPLHTQHPFFPSPCSWQQTISSPHRPLSFTSPSPSLLFPITFLCFLLILWCFHAFLVRFRYLCSSLCFPKARRRHGFNAVADWRSASPLL
jgi:hypothetical protein